MIVCQTDRLTIRRLVPEDEPTLFLVYSDPDAMRYVGDGTPISREDCARWMGVTEENYAKRGYGMFAVDRRDSCETVGFCGLVHPGGQPEPEIKYAFLRDQWGKGFATEAGRALLAWGRDSAGMKEIISTVAPENAPSHAVLLKLGMRKVRTDHHADGATDVYSITYAQI